jgi:hypothetical protein
MLAFFGGRAAPVAQKLTAASVSQDEAGVRLLAVYFTRASPSLSLS